MSQNLTVRVEFNGQNRTGMSKSNKPYWILGGYATLPGIPYPQAIELFTSDVNCVKAPGHYAVPVTFSVEEKRPAVAFDLLNAKPIDAPAAAKAGQAA